MKEEEKTNIKQHSLKYCLSLQHLFPFIYWFSFFYHLNSIFFHQYIFSHTYYANPQKKPHCFGFKWELGLSIERWYNYLHSSGKFPVYHSMLSAITDGYHAICHHNTIKIHCILLFSPHECHLHWLSPKLVHLFPFSCFTQLVHIGWTMHPILWTPYGILL